MGLTKSSSGFSVAKGDGFFSSERGAADKTVAFLGNPNVGKSSLFNALTGMDQHTGNWSGKTVTGAVGRLRGNKTVLIADLPGTYSLIAESAEEAVARDCVVFERPDMCVVVCDASAPERGLPLVLQAMELSDNVVVCFNLQDRAEKNGVKLDVDELSRRMGIPAVLVSARRKRSVEALAKFISEYSHGETNGSRVGYPDAVEDAVTLIASEMEKELADGNEANKIPLRFVAHRLLEGDAGFAAELRARGLACVVDSEAVTVSVANETESMKRSGIISDDNMIKDITVSAIIKKTDLLLDGIVTRKSGAYSERDRRVDRVLTGRLWGYPVMLCLLLFTLWLTVVGANYPSELLSLLFERVGRLILRGFDAVKAPAWLSGIFVDGVYRVLTFVVSVMLPPMAIFFPLFTFLEDVGYLPRIAYNLDRPFRCCGSCGKQALTMCMGLGCNAAGVVGCRIIESPKQRIMAAVTNSMVPCNGRFPTLIALITIFFSIGGGVLSSAIPTLMLGAVIILGVAMTFLITKLLSVTLFKSERGAFALEMPPYRPPRIGSIIVRSVFDRTLFVLGRAAAVAAPTGAVIWLMANVTVGNASLLSHISNVLDPIGRIMGLDGAILFAFILGFPANEIVLPVVIMAYTSGSVPIDVGSYAELWEILAANGWTSVTAFSFILFSLFHWPCSTTLITVKKETGSLNAALLSAVIPTAVGIILCVAANALIGWL